LIDIFVTLYRCRSRWQERRHVGLRDVDTEVNRPALRLSARRASSNHTVWSQRNRKDFPRTPTGGISRLTVRHFTANAVKQLHFGMVILAPLEMCFQFNVAV